MESLRAIFSPQNVAVIGATEKMGSVGRTILRNLISTPFGGTVFPVNPKRPGVLGIKAYPSIGEVPEQVDLAVIVTPSPTVPGIIGQCVEAGVKGAIVISAGFKETGDEGIELERQVLEQARSGNMRIIGPNCLGVMRPPTGFNATFATKLAKPGKVGFISQSGALCTAILDWSFQENVGFSAFVSIGSMLDVGWGDLVDFLHDDPNTESIVIYMESIGKDARNFLSAAREVGWTKPIIVIKAGQTEEAAKAAASHTGALTGSDEVLNSAFERCGVLRVERISDLFHMAEVLSKQPRPKGPRLTIITNAGGPGVLATDSLINGGGELTELSDETVEQYNKILPMHWSHGNPVDILGDATPERYAKSLDIAIQDPNSDGLLVVLTPQAMTDPTKIAEELRHYAENSTKPVLSSWMGGVDVAAGNSILDYADIPTFDYPDTAARVFNYMWRYEYNLRGLYETPELPSDTDEAAPDRSRAESLIEAARSQGRTLLTEAESKDLLAAYHIPISDTRVATTVDDAVQAADAMGYPVVLKLHSLTITHKTDVGGVQLNLPDANAVREAYKAIQSGVTSKKGAEHFQGVTVQPMIIMEGYELILGSSLDPQFGPVLLFGTGGQLVEVFKDRALALPPLNTTLARRMMETTKIYKALQGVRGRDSVDMDALELLMVRFGQLVVEQRMIKEIDINPLLVSADRIIAVDARVVLHDKDVKEDEVPKLTIAPYPTKLVSQWELNDGTPVTIRPIRPEDEPMLRKFHETLSEQSVYFRFSAPLSLEERIAHERLARNCFIDYDREIALIVYIKDEATSERNLIGVGRMRKRGSRDKAEFTITISDAYQRKGAGIELLRRLIEIAKEDNRKELQADIIPENERMQSLCSELGFELKLDEERNVVRASLQL